MVSTGIYAFSGMAHKDDERSADCLKESYEDIRKDAEKQGYSMTDRKFTELVQYAERKAAVAGKDESYIPYLLPDVIKEYFDQKCNK